MGGEARLEVIVKERKHYLEKRLRLTGRSECPAEMIETLLRPRRRLGKGRIGQMFSLR